LRSVLGKTFQRERAVKEERLKGILGGDRHRITEARREIFAAIEEIKGHFDPQMLYEILKSRGSKISRATVYRTIPMFVDEGILEEADKTDKHAHYEKKTGDGHHDHLVCLRCGRTIEFYSPTLEMLQDEICRREAFTGVRHTLVIMGYCQECSVVEESG
jgi:Fur family transcriptional regulator, ferric uptake regulator